MSSSRLSTIGISLRASAAGSGPCRCVLLHLAALVQSVLISTPSALLLWQMDHVLLRRCDASCPEYRHANKLPGSRTRATCAIHALTSISQALYSFAQFAGNSAIGSASTLLMLRTVAIWNRNLFVTVPLVILSLGQWAILFHGTE